MSDQPERAWWFTIGGGGGEHPPRTPRCPEETVAGSIRPTVLPSTGPLDLAVTAAEGSSSRTPLQLLSRDGCD